MQDIFRIFEVRQGVLYELAYVVTKQSTQFYLESCNSHNTDENVFYFAQKIQIER